LWQRKNVVSAAQLAQLEARLAQLEARLAQLEARLAQPLSVVGRGDTPDALLSMPIFDEVEDELVDTRRSRRGHDESD
jgi:outer membrane protein TolC